MIQGNSVVHIVSGEMVAGEANKTVSAIAARQRNSRWFYYMLLLTFWMVGGLSAWGVTLAINAYAKRAALMPADLLPIGIVLGSVAYTLFCRKFTLHRFKRNMTARDLSVNWTQNVRLTETSIVIEGAAVTRSANWSAVTEVFKSKDYWIFLDRIF